MSIVVQVQTILNDQGAFWPTQTVIDAVNEAQFHVYAETRWAITTATISLTTNQDIITIPPTIIIPKWIEGVNSNFQPPVVKRFFPSTMRELENFLRQWRGQQQGQPGYFVLWDATHWRVFPRPDSLGPNLDGSYPFTIYGIGFPAEIVDNVADIVGPATYVQIIQNYSVALLYEATRPDLADMYMAQAQQQILDFKKRVRNNQRHNIRILKPATRRFEIDQSGNVSETPTYYPLES
jgi:hypothetical protein